MRNFIPEWAKKIWRVTRSFRDTFILINSFWHMGPSNVSGFMAWIRRDFVTPAPQAVKWSVLRRWGGERTWIESGTFTGDTTQFLSTFSNYVYSIEPSRKLVKMATKRFSGNHFIRIIEGLSEVEMPRLLGGLSALEREDISFWLDGHYSAGITFQGPSDTPINEELRAISEQLPSFEKVTVLVDDIRCFDPSVSEYASYPSLNYLSKWAESNGLFWTIEYDIFIATNRNR